MPSTSQFGDAHRQRRVLRLLAVVILSAFGTSIVRSEQPNPSGVEFFENRIRPVLIKHCYECHSIEAGSSKGGLLLDTRAGIRRGGDSGPAVVTGEVDASLLVDAIRYESFQMPPDGRLPDAVIADFVTWVKLGAPDPRDETLAVSAAQNIEKDFWAFRPPQRSSLSPVANPDWASNEIDHLLQARLQVAGLSPVRDAQRNSLVRRVYFDLIGLPPTPKQVSSFVNDPRPTHVVLRQRVDQLLDSPLFGQRWARHWLDVARYAESTGKEWNWAHPEAWRYRDYVIESFNEDKPYDQFLREQIAGDLLPASDAEQRDDHLVATGFLAIGPKSVSIGNDEQFNLDLADEQINTISRALLGLTVGCARCHDHKFDPIPTEDYYALSGIFLSTQTLFGTAATGFKGRNNNQGTPMLPIGPRAAELQAEVDRHEGLIADAKRDLSELEDKLKKLEESDASEAKPQPPTDRPQDSCDSDIAELKQRIAEQERQLERLEADPPAKPSYAMGVRERETPQDCEVRLGGEYKEKGDAVPRGFLTALALNKPLSINPQQSGRLELAEWLTDPNNALTARVMVNRIWQHLFGRGLVSTTDNFGWLGQRPSHPQLLDHLAVEFMEDGWSIKKTIRKMMLSHTYRLSTSHDPRLAEIDAENVLLWRMSPRRLEAEEIRDAILAISGRLKCEPLAGSPAVARLDPGWVGNEVKEPAFKNYTHNHRSVYLPIVRDQIPEVLQTFGFPNPAEVTGRREVSVLPAQALYLMNSDFLIDCSRDAAKRLLATADQSEFQRLDVVYQTVLSRMPTAKEQARSHDMLEDVKRMLIARGRSVPEAESGAWAALYQALLSSGEFLILF